jgi:hypothetical protein
LISKFEILRRCFNIKVCNFKFVILISRSKLFTRLLGVNADEVKVLPQWQKQMVQIQLHLTTERKNKFPLGFEMDVLCGRWQWPTKTLIFTLWIDKYLIYCLKQGQSQVLLEIALAFKIWNRANILIWIRLLIFSLDWKSVRTWWQQYAVAWQACRPLQVKSAKRNKIKKHFIRVQW